MIKFDCGRAPGLEKRLKREPDEADRTEAKVGVMQDPDSHCPSTWGGGHGGHPAGRVSLQRTFVSWIPASPL